MSFAPVVRENRTPAFQLCMQSPAFGSVGTYEALQLVERRRREQDEAHAIRAIESLTVREQRRANVDARRCRGLGAERGRIPGAEFGPRLRAARAAAHAVLEHHPLAAVVVDAVARILRRDGLDLALCG